ncbi:hypothetical protein AADY61_004237 [Salmonella enterica]
MTLNTSQVSYYMTQRKKGVTQHISAMKAGISVRSGRRIDTDRRFQAGFVYGVPGEKEVFLCRRENTTILPGQHERHLATPRHMA